MTPARTVAIFSRLQSRPWRLCLAVLALALLSACNNNNNSSSSNSSSSAPRPATTPPPRVTMPDSQSIQIRPAEVVAQTPFGQIAYAASGLTGELNFALTGVGADAFAVNAAGEISSRRTIDQLNYPVLLSVSVSLAGAGLASTRLRIESVSEQTEQPAGVSLPAGQKFVVSDVRRGASVGRVAFSPTSSDLIPALVLSGSGSEYFAIDSSGALSVRQTIEAEQFAFQLLLSASLPAAGSLAQTALQISSPARTPDPPPDPISGPNPPPNPGLAVFAPNSQHTVALSASDFSEASAPGSCIARFAPSRPQNDPCWGFVALDIRLAAVAGDIVYELADSDKEHYTVADNLLLLRKPPRFADATGPLERRVRLTARLAGGSPPSEIEIILPARSPRIVYNGRPVGPVPFDVPSGIITDVGFEIVYGAPDRRLDYVLEDAPDKLAVSIGSDGLLRYDISQGLLVANQRYVVTVRTEIGDFPSAGQMRHSVIFTTVAPQVSFARTQYEFVLSPDSNRAFAAVGTAPASIVPAQALVDYEIINDPAGNFFAAAGGAIFLRRALSAPASAGLRAVSGSASASASFTVSVASVDFSAVPVDAASTRRNIRFEAVVPSGVAVESYRWDFGDGSASSTGASTTHLYTQTGSFPVTLEILTRAGQRHAVTHTVYPHLGEDPYKQMQWHLRQSTVSPFLGSVNGLLRGSEGLKDLEYFTTVYSSVAPPGMDSSGHTLAVAGEDIRAPDHLQSCGVLDTCRGEDIVVLVADSGVQLDHPDLIANTGRGLSRNLITGAPDLLNPYTPPLGREGSAPEGSALAEALKQSNFGPMHATAVAGIILAEDSNDIGVVGVAPRAELASYNLIDSGVSDLTASTVLGASYDVSNHSWHFSAEGREYSAISQSFREAVEQAATSGRGGRGAVIVKAAGNEGAGPVAQTGILEYPDGFGNRHNSGLDGHNAMPESLTVAGVRASGEENIQSEGGSNILLSAYWALPCRYRAATEARSNYHNPVGIVTTDLVGGLGNSWGVAPLFVSATEPTPTTFLGASNAIAEMDFQLPGQPLSPQALDNPNDYHYCFNGTSGAAPQVTGAIALMLQARPELGWRDVRAILAKTARQNAPTDPRWAANGAGRSFHPNYGFGVLDTTAAINEARTWTLLPAEVSHQAPASPASFTVADCISACGRSASDAGTATETSVSVSGQMGFVETVQAEVNLAFQAAPGFDPEQLRGSIEIALEHRDGNGRRISRSLLQKRHPYYERKGLGGGSTDPQTGRFEFSWTYLSLRHFGEDSSGSWHLIITDFFDDSSVINVEYQLTFRGH